MQKISSFIFSLSFLFLFSGAEFKSEVFVCKGSNSKRYHASSKCRGLNNCSTDIYKVSVKEAKELGRTPCKIEYK